MSNMEQAMRQLAAEMTGKELSEVPEGTVEEIVQWIAENYSGGETSIPEATTEAIGGVKKATAVEFTTGSATAETCATAIAALIANLKAAGTMA